MKEKYLEKLEFNQIKKILSDFAITYIGKDLVMGLFPSNNSTEVQNLLNETTESFKLLYRKSTPPIVEIPNITVHLKTLASGSVLSSRQLLDLATILKLARNLKEYFIQDNIDTSFCKIISAYFNTLYSNPYIENTVFSSIIDENTFEDNASPALASIRRNIRKYENNIRTKLNSFLSSKYVGEPIITIRAGRFVVPIKSEYRAEVKGFVHDISSSGSTVFIEPISVFELNNELNSLKMEEANEIEKILQKLTSLFYDLIDKLENNIVLIGKIDFSFAKAKYAKTIRATEPILCGDKAINFIQARHPLIDANSVVPINIHIGNNFSTLVITGPNTGGKTVTLKTVGLLCAMACSGLYIPTSENSTLYVFDAIFADIGDEQSIQESLSTFSSHMCNIIEITHCATSNSLILLDELGSGTDPIEGASLAISILEYFHQKGALTISTTHYQEIKNFALVTDGFENASSEFDIENLKPTYKLLIGVPGKSNAFAISKKLGLDTTILDRAKNFINSDTIHIEELLKTIYDDKHTIENEKQKILENSATIESLKKSLEKENLDLKEKSQAILNKAKSEAKNILLSAKEEADAIIRDLNSFSSAKKANQLRNNLKQKIKDTHIEQVIPQGQELTVNDIQVGNEIFIPALNCNGIILSLPNKSGEINIQVGNSKMYFSISNLRKVTHPTQIKSIPSNTAIAQHHFKSSHVSTEINLLGFNVEEAIVVIDKYLDDCVLANLPSVRIVHGKGTGALRKRYSCLFKKSSSC